VLVVLQYRPRYLVYTTQAECRNVAKNPADTSLIRAGRQVLITGGCLFTRGVSSHLMM